MATIRTASTRTIAAAMVLSLLVTATAGAQTPPAGFPPDFVARLRDGKEIYVATMRKDGSRSSVVPVWFAYVDGAVWLSTSPDSYKARRVKHGSPMLVAVEGADGPFVKTKAEIADDPAMADRLSHIYSDKYWIAWLGFFRPSSARLQSGEIVLIRLTPAQ